MNECIMPVIGCVHTFGEHNLCPLDIYIIGCALPPERAQPLFSYIYLIIIFASLSIRQYLDYIENVGVKSFVLVAIELLVFIFTFRCMV